MRYRDLFEDIGNINPKDDEPNRLSPFTLGQKRFINPRATGPNGARLKDGSVKDKFKDQMTKDDEESA